MVIMEVMHFQWRRLG